jgi:hypothetical protein
MKNVIRYTIAFVILFFSFYCGFIDKYPVMVISFLSFVFLMFLYNLDKISEIRATKDGLELKAREIIKEAEITIEEMQDLGKTLIKTELSLIMRAGRFGGYSEEEKREVKQSILDILKELKVPEKEQSEIFDGDWNKFIAFDYVGGILGNGRMPQGLTEGEIEEWKALGELRFNGPTPPEKLEAFLDKCGCLSQERKEYIEDYKYFLTYKEHRRPDIWSNLDNWKPLVKGEL